jgi:hypothetical protein
MKEAEQEKKNKVPQRTVGRQVFTLNEEGAGNAVGHIGKRRIEHGNEIRCDDCQNLCYESSIPRHDKDHIPSSEDGVALLSHLPQRRKHRQQH